MVYVKAPDDGHNKEATAEVWLDADEVEDALKLQQNNDGHHNVNDQQASEAKHQQKTQVTILVQVSVLVLVLWQKMFKVSDSAIKIILCFISALLLSIYELSGCDILLTTLQVFPSTWYKANKMILPDIDGKFDQYVACPRCDKLHLYKDSYFVNSRGKTLSKRCGHNAFPRNKRSKACDAFLLKSCRSKAGTEFLYPKRIACIRSISSMLTEMAARPGFRDLCESWKQRQHVPGYFEDIYDGKVWQEMSAYLEQPGINLSLTLNIDWYQPFENTTYSVGVILAVINNLPREQRFQEENIMLLGLIPGPKEPQYTINTYLKPIVDELLNLWTNGIYIRNDGTAVGSVWRAVVTCVSCDLPAMRKLCGFAGIAAERGI